AEDTVREYVGFGLDKLMETLAPDAPTADAVACYREHHPSVMLAGTRLLPGVAETLADLHRRGLKLAVCSNKAVAFTKRLVAHFGLAPVFADVLGPDDVGAAKPDPAMLLEGLRRLGVSRDETVYVGDMAIDVRTAKAAGIPVWLVPGGAAGMECPRAAGPDRMLGSFPEISELLPAVE
ncbi:MAG: HAD family hydrolase, partial [Fimbriiglobus sp.]